MWGYLRGDFMIEKDFKDRIPKHPGRIRLVPVEGQQNTFDLTKADEPTEPGTALNREAFNSIIHSRLTGRYYTPTATRTIATQRTITVNPIPSSGWLNTTLTGATSGEYTITASNSHNTEWSPHKAVDNDLKTSWTSAGYTTYGNTWWQIKLPSPIVLTSFTVSLDDLSDSGADFVLQGSTNGTNWKDLTSQFDYNGKVTNRVFAVNNSTEYAYYRLNFRTESEYSATIYEFAITGYTITTYANAFVIASGVPLVWSVGQRITIQTPSNVSTAGTVSNTLNGIAINTILLPSRKYELVYNGSSFVAKEV